VEREPRDPAVAGGAEPRADELHSALTSDGWSALQIEVPLANVRVEDQRHLARVLAMEVAGRLHQLTAAELAPAVQNALRDDQAWPLTWEFEALDWTGNPATVGLFPARRHRSDKRWRRSAVDCGSQSCGGRRFDR
jgi:hypothetical protein